MMDDAMGETGDAMMDEGGAGPPEPGHGARHASPVAEDLVEGPDGGQVSVGLISPPSRPRWGLEASNASLSIPLCLQALPSPVDSLPDELMLNILSRVPLYDILHNVPRVCRRWERLAQDPEVWRFQELLYRSYSSDAEFTECLPAISRIARLDLSGLRKGSAAERHLDWILPEVRLFALAHGVSETEAWQPANPVGLQPSVGGLELVLSDEMDCRVAVRLIEKLLRSLVTVRVGPMLMRKDSYGRMIHLLEEAPRLRELHIAASVRMVGLVDDMFFGMERCRTQQLAMRRIEVRARATPSHSARQGRRICPAKG